MKKDKLFMIISISLLVICIIGSTYALYRGILSKKLGVNTTTHGLDYYINYVKGNDIDSSTLNPSPDYTGGSSSDIEFWKKNDTYDIYGKIELTVNTIGTNLSNSPALKYSVINNSEVLSTGSLQGTTAGSKITILENLHLKTTKQIYTVYIWLDNNEELGDISDEPLSISVDCTASMFPTSAAQKIINLYTNASKSTVTNNSITYNTAPSVGLMNDRLGSSSTDINGGNIRYYGANPDNYIYFNCSDYSNQSDSTCEKWRIIGVFDGKVKIIRNESIGEYSWNSDTDSNSSSTSLSENNDTTKNVNLLINEDNNYKTIFLLPESLSSSNNNWNQSSLMKLLNYGYESKAVGGSLYYNSGSGTCYSGENNATTSCDFTSTGIKNDITRSLISDTLYYLGGWNDSSVYSDQIYGYERGTSVYSGRPTTWTGKIALPYPSDYGYAADLGSCTVELGSYNNSTCTSVNWMKSIFTSYSWLLTHTSDLSNYAWNINSSGNLSHFNRNGNTYVAYGVAPVLYLSSELGIESGTGTSSEPYRLSV